jgi:hypothetical protein
MATERDILPTIENMYVFPIIAMMVNLARLRYLNAYHRVRQNWSDVNSKTIQKPEEIDAK